MLLDVMFPMLLVLASFGVYILPCFAVPLVNHNIGLKQFSTPSPTGSAKELDRSIPLAIAVVFVSFVIVVLACCLIVRRSRLQRSHEGSSPVTPHYSNDRVFPHHLPPLTAWLTKGSTHSSSQSSMSSSHCTPMPMTELHLAIPEPAHAARDRSPVKE